MNNNRLGITVAALAIAAAGAVGCASEAEQSTEQTSANNQPLTSVTRGLVHVDFYVTGVDEDGAPHIVLLEGSSAFVSGSPVTQLAAKRATSLEIYHALAGRDKKAPDELLLAHVAESKKLERANADELDVTIDDTLVQKSAQSCAAWVFADPDIGQHWLNTFAPGLQSRTGSVGTAYVYGPKLVGICNESNVNMVADYRIWQNQGGTLVAIAAWSQDAPAQTQWRLWDTVGASYPERFYVGTAGAGIGNYYYLRRATDISYM